MNRNITIVTIILVLAVLAGYLVWVKSRAQQQVVVTPNFEEPQEQIEAAALSPIEVSSKSAEATPSPTTTVKMATGSAATRSGVMSR